MKKILFILLLLPFFAESQTYQSMPQAGYGPVKRMIWDSVISIPLGITSLRNISGGRDVGQLRYNVADSSPYIYSGYQWIKIGGGTGSSQWTDVTGGINYSGGKVGIGTSTPVYKFDVNGTAGATDLEITNSVNVGNGVSTGGILHADGNLETQDSVKFTNLTSKVLDTTNYKPLVIGSTGNVHTTNWFSSGGGSSWSLTGNIGINPAINFIGTTDAQPLVFKVNNSEVGRFDTGTYSVALGQSASATNIGATAMSGASAGGQFSFANGQGTSASGDYSFASGTSSTIASGLSATAIGSASTASGAVSIAIGQGITASGDYSTGIGVNTTPSGTSSTAIGNSTIASGERSTALGDNTTSRSFSENSFGMYNDDYTPTSTNTWVGTDRLFQVGNGKPIFGTSNALTILKNGNVGIGTTTPTATLDVDGSIRFRTGGTAGYVLTSDASGNATWQTAGAGSGWGLNGNTGITSANYLGTTDGANLILKSAGNIIDSSDGRSIVTIGANINLISGVGITLTSGNKEITLNGVDTSTDATDSLLTINTSNIVKKRAYPTMPTNYWNKNADSNIYVIDTLAYVGIGTSIPTSALDVRGTIRSQGVVPDADSVGSIGSSPNRWKELWLNGGDALYLGTVNITDSSFATGKVLTGSNTGRAVWKTPQTVDTSLFALKSMPSYSLRVNNTNATANATTDNFRTVGETSLATSDTVTWSGSTAPSGGTSNTYRWTQIGNRVWVDITLSNTSNGSGVTGVVVKLPSTLPAIAEPTGQTAANQYMYPVNAVFVSSSNVVLSALARGGIRNNSVNNAYEMEIKTSSVAPCTGTFSFTYTTN